MMLNGHTVQVTAWLRFAGQIVFMLMLAAGVYFNLDNRVSNVEKLAATTLASQQTMDAGGTHKSHETDFGQQAQIDETVRRVANLESILRDLVPKVERIDTNVLVLMGRERK
jgi:hypothetical protein